MKGDSKSSSVILSMSSYRREAAPLRRRTLAILIVVRLTGTEAAAGLPLGLLVVGQAAAAVLLSRRTPLVAHARLRILAPALG